MNTYSMLTDGGVVFSIYLALGILILFDLAVISLSLLGYRIRFGEG